MWPSVDIGDLEILAGVMVLLGIGLLALAARIAKVRRDRIRSHEDVLRRMGT